MPDDVFEKSWVHESYDERGLVSTSKASVVRRRPTPMCPRCHHPEHGIYPCDKKKCKC